MKLWLLLGLITATWCVHGDVNANVGTNLESDEPTSIVDEYTIEIVASDFENKMALIRIEERMRLRELAIKNIRELFQKEIDLCKSDQLEEAKKVNELLKKIKGRGMVDKPLESPNDNASVYARLMAYQHLRNQNTEPKAIEEHQPLPEELEFEEKVKTIRKSCFDKYKELRKESRKSCLAIKSELLKKANSGNDSSLEQLERIQSVLKKIDWGYEKIIPIESAMAKIRSRTKESFAVEVVGAIDGTVHGTGIYSAESPIAVAAVHAGLVKVGEKRTIYVNVLGEQNSFQGAIQNGVQSKDLPGFPFSYSLEAYSYLED